jgi:hypothetical protein
MLDNLTEDQRKVLLIWFFFGLFLIILVVLFANYKIKEKKNKELIDDHYIVVSDYNRYYTVSNILDKYYTSLYNGRFDRTLKMLDSEYISKNEITEDNLKTKLGMQDVRVTFKGGKMCSRRFENGITSYYVVGDEVAVNKYKVFNTKYYEVVLNEKELTFTIKEIDSDIYGGECNA